MEYQDSISIEELAPEVGFFNFRQYKIHFFERKIITVVTSDPLVINDWIMVAMEDNIFYGHHCLVGFGTKWHQGENPNVLQLCYDHRCLIIKGLTQLEFIPLNLHRFLNNPGHTFVGVADTPRDVEMLANVNDLLRISSRFLDVRTVVAERLNDGYIRQYLLPTILSRVYFYPVITVTQSVLQSNWNSAELNLEQVVLATVEAHFAWSLGFDCQVWPPPPPPPPPQLILTGGIGDIVLPFLRE